MAGHDVLYQIGLAAGAMGSVVDLPDTTGNVTLELEGRGIARVKVGASGTITLPDAGFCVQVYSPSGGGKTGTVVDSVGGTSIDVADNEAAVFFRSGESTWYGIELSN